MKDLFYVFQGGTTSFSPKNDRTTGSHRQVLKFPVLSDALTAAGKNVKNVDDTPAAAGAQPQLHRCVENGASASFV
jgi:hypothetical protein